ncbi:hypothetical protein PMAYCL1PPCAC_20848, partial [Pristionchus mayeri]
NISSSARGSEACCDSYSNCSSEEWLIPPEVSSVNELLTIASFRVSLDLVLSASYWATVSVNSRILKINSSIVLSLFKSCF